MTSVYQPNPFELKHTREPEPWSFSGRAAEILRHEWIERKARSLAPRTVLDAGCSLGQLTWRLARLPGRLSAIDLSETAARRARDRLRQENGNGVHNGHPSPLVVTGSTLSLPFPDGAFDLVVAADGLHSWDLDRWSRAVALRELNRVAAPGGYAILTEHLRPDRFENFVDEIAERSWTIVGIHYMYDRPWYQFESWLKAILSTAFARWLRRSLLLARILSSVGRAIGPRASRHICVVARKS